jgi:hypothetical protein
MKMVMDVCDHQMRLVRLRDREERQWQQYKANGISDAVKRAEFEAKNYLDSAEGSDLVHFSINQ